jgi:hypothetical protein
MSDLQEGTDATMDAFGESFMRLVRERLSIEIHLGQPAGSVGGGACGITVTARLFDAPKGREKTLIDIASSTIDLRILTNPSPAPLLLVAER